MFDSLQVFHGGITLRFTNTPDVNTLTYDSFELLEAGSTKSNAFKQIDIARHYNSLTLTLTLYFDFTLSENTKYTFNVLDGAILGIGGASLGSHTVTFAVVTSDSFSETVDIELGEPPPETFPEVNYELDNVQIVDYSIRHNVFGQGGSSSGGQQDPFRVVATTPQNEEIYVDQDFNLGKINIWFSKRPDPEFVNHAVFRVQRKKLGIGQRWDEVSPTKVDLHDNHPLVTIRLPALKQTETYETSGFTYFEKGYKYRVKISGYLPSES